MNNSFIYMIKDPRFKSVRYVGQTSVGEARFKAHMKPSSLKRKLRVANWLKSLVSENVMPTFEIIERCEEYELDDLEIFYIEYFRSLGCDLVNHSTGGHGTRGIELSKETKDKISAGGRGLKRSDETKQRIAQGRLGIKHKPDSEQARANKSAGRIGKKHSEETKAKIAAGNTGKVFSVERKANISKALRGKNDDGNT